MGGFSELEASGFLGLNEIASYGGCVSDGQVRLVLGGLKDLFGQHRRVQVDGAGGASQVKGECGCPRHLKERRGKNVLSAMLLHVVSASLAVHHTDDSVPVGHLGQDMKNVIPLLFDTTNGDAVEGSQIVRLAAGLRVEIRLFQHNRRAIGGFHSAHDSAFKGSAVGIAQVEFASHAASVYFNPEPVLKRTTVSSLSSQPRAKRSRRATRQAAPSGAAKIPSVEAMVETASRIASSVTAMAVPPLSRMARKIRKSPIARGTRRPEAKVRAFCHVSALSFPSSKARTMGAHPVD